MKKQKFGYLIARFPVPSETFIYREVLGLHELGLSPTVYTFSPPTPVELEKLPNKVKELSRATRIIPTFRRIQSVGNWFRSVTTQRLLREYRAIAAKDSVSRSMATIPLRAAHLADQMKADGITHLHAHWPYATRVAHLAHKLTGIPYSISVHAHEVAYDNRHFPTVFKSLKFASFCNRAAMEFVGKLVPESAMNKAHLIYHGVDTNQFEVHPVPTKLSPLRIISIGRFTKTKGFDRLIRACGAACRAGIDLRLTLVGDGALRQELERIVGEQGIADRVTFAGWLPPSEIQSQLSTSHLFALLADVNYHDGLPNVVLEAMSCGRPAIVSPLPAASEAIEHDVDGFILEHADDEEGFVQICRKLSSDHDLLQKIGQNASNRVRRDHDALVHLQKMAELFNT